MQRHSNVPASYLVLFKGDQVLLLKRANTGFYDGHYSVIAGHVEPGESFTDCVIREAKEEAGILIAMDHLKVAHVMHRNSGEQVNNERVDTFFIAEKWENNIVNQEPEKCDDLSWFDLDRLPENMIPYVKEVIESIKKNVYYSEYGWNEF